MAVLGKTRAVPFHNLKRTFIPLKSTGLPPIGWPRGACSSWWQWGHDRLAAILDPALRNLLPRPGSSGMHGTLNTTCQAALKSTPEWHIQPTAILVSLETHQGLLAAVSTSLGTYLLLSQSLIAHFSLPALRRGHPQVRKSQCQWEQSHGGKSNAPLYSCHSWEQSWSLKLSTGLMAALLRRTWNASSSAPSSAFSS